MKKVSIITITYNHEGFIGQCIESVLAQTYPEWEQIIIDDGSSDNTRGIIKQYQDPRIHYYYQTNKGILRLRESYNRALSLATGEIIAILEGDDFWPPNKLETLVPAFDDPEIILAYGLTQLVTATGKKKRFTIPSSQVLNRFPHSTLCNDPVGSAACIMARSDIRTFTFPCALLIREKILQHIGGFQNVPGLSFIDYPTFITLSLQGKYFFIPKVMGYWRQHIRSDTQSRNEEKTSRILRKFVLQFLDINRSSLPVSLSELKTIIQTWNYIPEENALRQGRKLLLMKRWKKARFQFKKAFFGEKRPKQKIAAAIGYYASWLHQDIEWLYSLTGRASLQELLTPSSKKDN
ncbi:MAG: glycosyltransferase family 2 protein [Candidatus Aminicenantia bacterium]